MTTSRPQMLALLLVMAGCAGTMAPATEQTTLFVGGDDRDHYRISAGAAGAVQTCVTPCVLPLPAGRQSVEVDGPRRFVHLIDVPRGPSTARVGHRSTAALIAGAILTGVALTVGVASFSIAGAYGRPGTAILPTFIALPLAAVGLPMIATNRRDRVAISDGHKVLRAVGPFEPAAPRPVHRTQMFWLAAGGALLASVASFTLLAFLLPRNASWPPDAIDQHTIDLPRIP